MDKRKFFINIGILLFYIIILLTVYSNSLYNNFLRDDIFFIKQEYIDNSLTLKNFIYYLFFPTNLAPTEKDKIYRPMIQYSFMLCYWLGGECPYYYHIFNILLHAINSFLVFLVLKKILSVLYERWNTNLNILSFIGSLIYLLHPLNSQVVLYIHARTCSIYTFFYLIAFLLYTNKRYIISSLFLFFSLLSKETALTFLPLILLWEFILYKKINNKNTLNKILKIFPRFFYIILTVIVYLIIRQLVLHGSDFSNINITKMNNNLLFTNRRNIFINFITQLCVILRYLYLFIIPIPLNINYNFIPIVSLIEIRFILTLLFYIGLFLFLFYLYKKDNYILIFSIISFFITHSITMIIPLNVIVNEHRMYVPIIFLIIILLYILDKFILKKYFELLIFLIFLLIFSYIIRDRDRAKDWKNMITLYGNDIKRGLYIRYAKTVPKYFITKKRYKIALKYIDIVCKENMMHPLFFGNEIVKCYIGLKNYKKAFLYLRELEKVYEREKDIGKVNIYLNIIYLFYMMKEYKKMEKVIEYILNRNYGDKVIVNNDEGHIIFYDGEHKLIEMWFDDYISDKEVKSAICYEIGLIYYNNKDYSRALNILFKSLNYKPYIFSYILLGKIYYILKKFKQAEFYFGKAFDSYLEYSKNKKLSLKRMFHVILIGTYGKRINQVKKFIDNKLKKYPLSYYLYLGKSCFNFYLKKYKKAIEYAKKSIYLNKVKKEAYNFIIKIYVTLKLYNKANKYNKILQKIKDEEIKDELRIEGIYY